MTTTRDSKATRTDKMPLAEIFEILLGGDLSIRIEAYDGSTAGPQDARYGLRLKNARGTTYLVTAPGDLGLARAYISGDLELIGAHPADPYEALRALAADSPPAPDAAGTGADRPIARHRALQADRTAAPGSAAPVAPVRRRLAAQSRSRRRGDPSPLRRLEHLL